MMEIDVLFAGLPVADLDIAIEWYGRLFGRPPDVTPNDTEVMWRANDGAWIYVIREPQRAGHALAALSVDDLDEVLRDLEKRAIVCGPIEIVGDAGRKSVITDPDGNALSFIEVASTSS